VLIYHAGVAQIVEPEVPELGRINGTVSRLFHVHESLAGVRVKRYALTALNAHDALKFCKDSGTVDIFRQDETAI
jgi:hypothetical protein